MIYLDHAATTPIHEDVLQQMVEIEKTAFGNPSSVHSFGRTARYHVNQARKYLAETIGAKDKEIIFTSGGTEAINLALLGTILDQHHSGEIIISAQEHAAVLDTTNYLAEYHGIICTKIPVDEKGRVNIETLERMLKERKTLLVSVMTVNNETGVIQPIREIGAMLKKYDVLFHTDAVQAYGLMDIDVNRDGIDLLTVSAHKLNGPKGIGFLYANERVPLRQRQFGGHQEGNMRSGTENVSSIVGFHHAAKLAKENREKNWETLSTYKNTFLEKLREAEVEFTINGSIEQSVPSIVNISFPGTKSDVLLTNLDLAGVAASSGSACSAGSLQPSHVLQAMFSEADERTFNAVRFSFGLSNTLDEIEEAAKRVAEVVHTLTQ